MVFFDCHPERSAEGAESKDLRFLNISTKTGAPHLEEMWEESANWPDSEQ
jgi:hypothetical protein